MIDDLILWGTPEELETEVDELRRSHPQWSEHLFLSWAADSYRDIDYARRKRDPGFVEHLMTGEFWQAFAKRATNKQIKVIDQPLDVQGVQIVWIGTEGDDDVIDVRFVGERRDEAGKLVPSAEFVTFIRPHYEHFNEPTAVVWSGRCPNCSGEVDLENDWRCARCGHNLAEQTTGWKISAIRAEKDYDR